MWKLVSAVRIIGNRGRKCLFTQGRRQFLSEAYQCQEAWERRYQAPVLQKVQFEEFYHELDVKYRRDGHLNEIDVDVFANAVKEETFADEVEDLVHHLRLSINSTKTLPSTSHALVRYLLRLKRYEQLFKILDDRLNYGIFPDDYCMCLLIDTLIKEENFTDAARASAIHMLQEDWSNPLLTSLALYACHMYAQNPSPWEVPQEEEDDGEEIKVRVAFIRNPFFDDHFDLRDPQLLVGKTLASIGATMSDPVGLTYHLVGLGFYKKWSKIVLFLEKLLLKNDKSVIFTGGIKLLEGALEREAKEEKGSLEPDVKDNIHKLLKQLESNGLVTSDDLHTAVVEKVKRTVTVHEGLAIQQQQKVYEEWERTRDELFKQHLEEIERQQRLEAVREEKERLIKRERELFFFDKEDELDLLIEKNETIQMEVMEQRPRRKQAKEEETYIPPEIR